jgi:hypothetical protein
MKNAILVGLALALVIGLTGVVSAADTSLTGSIMCAKCTLKKADAKEYYITKNDVLEKFGHTCTGEKPATVTGSVAAKDGKTWITATKIEEKKK